MPLSMLDLCAVVSLALYLGPSTDAAVICAATPILVALSDCICGPDVCIAQNGFEHK